MEPFKNFFSANYKKQAYAFLKKAAPSLKATTYFANPAEFPDAMAYRERVAEIAEAMLHLFDGNILAYYDSLTPVLAQEIEAQQRENDVSHTHSFFWEPFAHVVQEYGIDHLKPSLDMLELLTQLFTAEFAIRPFIAHYPKETMAQMQTWSQSSNVHLRRLSSEGCRPRLPWGKKLTVVIENPKLVWPILETLQADQADYVKKSVANHLNDWSWLDTAFFYQCIEELHKSSNPNTQWIVKHALRSEIKSGAPKALAILGYPAFQHEVTLKAPSNAILGKEINLACSLSNVDTSTKAYILDLQWELPGKKSTRTKVFKGWQGSVESGENKQWDKAFSLKDNSVRKYYPGNYRITPLVNGVAGKSISFVAQ